MSHQLAVMKRSKALYKFPFFSRKREIPRPDIERRYWTSLCRLCRERTVRAKIPTMCCGRRSRAFRAVLKRQEVKGRTELVVCCLYNLENPRKMTSEKADVIYPSPKKTKFEQLRADHELFLQAFESKSVVFRGLEIYTILRLIQFNGKALNLLFLDFSAFRTHANLSLSSNEKCCCGRY